MQLRARSPNEKQTTTHPPGSRIACSEKTMNKNALALSLCLLALSGCKSLSEKECVSANWYAVGLEDGAQGRPLERLGDHRRARAAKKIPPPAREKKAGREEGGEMVCTCR